MFDIVHRLGIRAGADTVYRALTTLDGLSNWWTRTTHGDPVVGGSITFSFRDHAGEEMGRFVMDVLALRANEEVVWRVREGAPEWIGTRISFSLSEQDGMTVLLFAHRGWREEVEFSAHCSMKWSVFLWSLRDFVEHGTGRPAPDDIKIDNWN